MEFQVYEYDVNKSKVIITATGKADAFVLGLLTQQLCNFGGEVKILEFGEVEFDAESIQNPNPMFKEPDND